MFVGGSLEVVIVLWEGVSKSFCANGTSSFVKLLSLLFVDCLVFLLVVVSLRGLNVSVPPNCNASYGPLIDLFESYSF